MPGAAKRAYHITGEIRQPAEEDVVAFREGFTKERVARRSRENFTFSSQRSSYQSDLTKIERDKKPVRSVRLSFDRCCYLVAPVK